jgi:hypothetical protein
MRSHKTASKAATALNVHRATITVWCKKYGLGLKVGGRWRIPIKTVELIRCGAPLAEVGARVKKK